MAKAPFLGLCDEVLGTGQARPGDAAKILVEGDVDGVEKPGISSSDRS